MQRFLLWSGKHPWVVTTIMAILSLVAIGGLFFLHLDTSIEGMIPSGSPEHTYYKSTTEQFGTDNITIVYVRDENLFTPEKLAALEDLIYALEEVNGVVRSDSLFTATCFRNIDGFLETRPIVDWMPEAEEEAIQIRDNALSNPILVGNLITEDGKGTAINLYVEEDLSENDFNIEFSHTLDRILEEKAKEFDTSFQLGLSYTRRLISDNILSDQIKLVPLSIIVLLFVLMFTMRSSSGAILPLVTAGFSVLWTAGFMGYASIPVNLLTVIVPSLIIVIGSTENIHILSEYMESLREGKKRMQAIDFTARWAPR